MLVALGGRAAIELAKLARVAIARGRNFAGLPDAAHPVHEPGEDQLPDLYVIPSFHGLTTAFSMQTIMNATWSGRIILTNRSFVPAVVILDPTLYIGDDPRHSASALAEAIACCAEAYLAPEYNPPAEGIAMDGLVRAFRAIGSSAKTDNLAVCREIVAAGLNGGLALQKGAGMTQTLSRALTAVADTHLDEGALSRVLLSGTLHFNNDLSSEKYRRLHQLLGIERADGFVDFVAAKFGELPLPVSLSKMGVGMEQLIAAAPVAAGDLSASKNPRRAGEQDLLGIMQKAY